MDFLRIVGLVNKRGVTEIYPRFNIPKSKDLMVKGGDFYAIYDQEKGMWSTDEDDAIRLIDAELNSYAEKHKDDFENGYRIMYLKYSETGQIDEWHKFVQRQKRDNYHLLDPKLTFADTVTSREDYASKRLSYSLEEGEPEAWTRLMTMLYSPEELHKIEWAIGCIVAGESQDIQKFIVLYGEEGTGKSTVLNILHKKLFKGYSATVDAKALGNSSDQFSLSSFRSNPLVAIDHEAKLSRIDDNSKINALVAHEEQMVNEKNLKRYAASFNTFMFLASNDPVKITNAKSGIMRRLIDVYPTGKKFKRKEYDQLMSRIDFELGKIALHCKKIFEEDPHYYDDYRPITMMEETNDFFNFVGDSYYIFKKEDGVSQQAAWDMYNAYCEKAKVKYPLTYTEFKKEIKNYFDTCKERATLADGTRKRKYYSGFRYEKFEISTKKEEQKPIKSWLEFNCEKSLFDDICKDYKAQYANEDEKPISKWENVTTVLADIVTTRTHYVLMPVNHIVIDFDIPDENGNKCFEKNLEAASLWPKTYAELSKSGQGIHLHYIYIGQNVGDISCVYDDHIEIKVFTGKSSLRRKLTKCNDIPIATISSGLPFREKKKMTDKASIKSEAKLVELIQRNLRKEIHPGTKPSVDFIYKILEDAYNSDLHYDVSWMKDDIYSFALASTHHSEECTTLWRKMKFQSKDISEYKESQDDILSVFDIESCPNHFLICYMLDKDDATVVPMLDPKADDIYDFIERKLVSYNGLGYDNHMLYGRMMGDDNLGSFCRSNDIIQKKIGTFREARNIGYMDLYQVLSKKQSLKKWEIELGLPHKEFPLPWDQPVPDEMLDEWIEYCMNDVRATRALMHAKAADVNAHKIFAKIANGSMNDTTNQLTTKFIFGNNRSPQSEFNYRDMGLISEDDTCPFDDDPYTRFNTKGQPIFPGYKHEFGKSWYRDEDPKQGGYVYAEQGIYCNVALLDIKSMHPASLIAENLFGDRYTQRFREIRDARIAIKEKRFDDAKNMLDGALTDYLNEDDAEDLAYALKIGINAVYGLTSASFENPCKDPRNKDNIVAKRGALFMINLKHQVQKRGFTVAHIKTDSIKIPDATPEIISFVMEYGKMYGYEFDHEATYEKMCLVNDAVYIAKYSSNESCMKQYGYIPSKQHEGSWTATGTQFQVPYVFKTLFSHEPIVFDDLCETREVKDPAALYLDFNDGLLEDEHKYTFIGKVGRFCPIAGGSGGGELMRGARNKETGAIKYDHAASSKGYRWMESEMVKNLHKESEIDRGYYQKLVDKAARDIASYGDLEWFLS